MSINGTDGIISTGTVSIHGGTTNTITGLSNTSWSGTTDNKSRAATEGELSDISGKISNINDSISGGLTFGADSGTAYKAPLGDTVNIKGDGKNISTPVSGSTITVTMSDTPTFTSVTAGSTVMNTNGVTIANGPSMTVSGIDAGSKKITNVADGNVSGTSTDAVNGKQLYEVQQSVTGDESAINTLGSEVNKLGVTCQQSWGQCGGHSGFTSFGF